MDPHRQPDLPDDPLPPDEAEAVHEPPPGHAPEPPGEPPPAPEAPPRLRGILESLLFAADRPLALERLVELATPEEGQGPGKAAVQQALAALAEDLQQQGRGIELHQVAGGYQLRTAPQNA